MLLRLLFIATTFLGPSIAQTTFYQAPDWAGVLQNVANPTKCLTSTSPNSISLADCDFSDPFQMIDFTNFQGWGTTPKLLKLIYEGRFLALNENGGYDGAGVQLSPQLTTNERLTWTMIYGTWTTKFKLQVTSGGRCLTAEVSASSAYLDMWGCQPQDAAPHQEWRVLQWPRGVAPAVVLKSVAYPDTCLDVLLSSTLNQAAIPQMPCNAASLSQRWYLTPQDAAVVKYNIKNVNSNMCLQVDYASTSNGATVSQWECLGYDHFLWYFRDDFTRYSATQKVYFLSYPSGLNPGKALTQELVGLRSDIYDYQLAAHQQFTQVAPQNYMLPTGQTCSNHNACLSDVCSVVVFFQICGKGAIGKPCQTANDCLSGYCANGNCNTASG